MSEGESQPRAGSGADLSKRIDRLEAKHDELSAEMTTLKGIVSRVEINQQHAQEINQLRFTALDTGVAANTAKLDAFIARFEGIVSGEIVLPQRRDGERLLAEWTAWRDKVERNFDDPLSHPATRELHGQITELRADVEEVKAIGNKNRQWIVGVAAVVSVVAFLIQAIGPTVLRALQNLS